MRILPGAAAASTLGGMAHGRRLRTTLVHAAVLAPLALACLLAGFGGIGRLGEDFCLSRAPGAAGAFRGPALDGVPPAFVCEYTHRDGGTVTTAHRLEPTAFLTLWAAGSAALLGGAAVAVSRLGARSRASRRRA